MTAHQYPALAAWQRELAAGGRTERTLDWLWRASCWEAAAQQADRVGSRARARQCQQQARKITDRATHGVA